MHYLSTLFDIFSCSIVRLFGDNILAAAIKATNRHQFCSASSESTPKFWKENNRVIEDTVAALLQNLYDSAKSNFGVGCSMENKANSLVDSILMEVGLKPRLTFPTWITTDSLINVLVDVFENGNFVRYLVCAHREDWTFNCMNVATNKHSELELHQAGFSNFYVDSMFLYSMLIVTHN